MIDEQALRVKKQKEDYTYFLDYESYKSERETNKMYSERFKKLGEYESTYDFQWLPEAGFEGEPNADLIKKRERWQKSLKKDIYISEAVEILKDLSTQIKADKTVAEVKN